jgi:ankyrin repeat protein
MDHSYSSNVNKTPVTNIMKPLRETQLTERQQMAILLQMTSEDNATPTRKGRNDFESPCSGQKSVNRRNERGETQLHVASIRGDVHKLRTLISQGADVNTEDYAGKSKSLLFSYQITTTKHYMFYQVGHLYMRLQIGAWLV